MCANRVLLLQMGTDERLTGRQHIASSFKEHQDNQLKRTSHSGCLHYASKVSSQPNRFICMNLSELMLASLLKLLPNNDVQARVQSHVCFFEWARLSVPDKVHSSVSRKIFSGCSSWLTLCRGATQLTSQPDSTSGSQKKTGVTLRAMSVFRWLTFTLGTVPKIHSPGLLVPNVMRS